MFNDEDFLNISQQFNSNKSQINYENKSIATQYLDDLNPQVLKQYDLESIDNKNSCKLTNLYELDEDNNSCK